MKARVLSQQMNFAILNTRNNFIEAIGAWASDLQAACDRRNKEVGRQELKVVFLERTVQEEYDIQDISVLLSPRE